MFVLLCSVLCVVCLMCVDCRCAQTLFYKSCWIRRVPARDVDVEESVRRGALILRIYHEDTASRCATACCTTHNFSCSLAVFHYNTTRDSVNCFHLHCSNPDSCVLHHRRNVMLYNVTKGVDPDLLVFDKHFSTNVRVLPHMSSSRLNTSEPLTSDKRHFNHPPNPPVRSISTTKPTSPHQTSRDVSTASENHLAGCTTKPASPADERTTPQIILTTQINPTPHSQHALTSQVTSSHLLHTTQPTDSTPHITQTDTFTSAPSPAQSSFTVTSIIPPSELQTYSLPGTLSTQQPLKLQTTTQRNYIKTTSITERPPPTTWLSMITSTTIKEFSQTITQNEMTETQTHPSSPSKSLTSPNPQTATQTNVPSQTMTHNNTATTVLPPTTASQAEETTSTVSSASSPTITTIRHVTLNFTRMRDSPSGPSSSVSGPTSSSSSRVDSQPYPNDTKGYISRNISTEESASPAADGGLTSVWRLAANTVLVALVTCVTVTFGCCCSVFAALRWRGRRRRKGRYRTDLRRQRGSMKLIKYVIVRESS